MLVVDTGPWNRQGPVFGDPRLAPQRLGQQAFKALLLVAYDRRCAITGSKIRPVLQASHIRPVTDGGEHRLDNGLLLSSDVHTLFDYGYFAVDPRYRCMSVRDCVKNSAMVSSFTSMPGSRLPCRRVGQTQISGRGSRPAY